LVALVLPLLSLAKLNTSSAGNKVAVTQDRQVPSFHALKVSGGLDVELAQGNSQKLQVEADEDIISFIRTEVTDGVLNIYREKDRHNWNSNTVKIHLTFQNLDAITAESGCDIESIGKINVPNIKLDLSGGCDLKLDCKADKIVCDLSGGCEAVLKGEAVNSTINASGGCEVKASELKLKNCTIDANGASEVIVNVTGELDITANGASEVTYSGNPVKVSKNAYGASEINRK
jgi:hypothetical protein